MSDKLTQKLYVYIYMHILVFHSLIMILLLISEISIIIQKNNVITNDISLVNTINQ